MPGPTYRAAVIGLGRMGSTFDDEITQGGSIFLPYCHAPTYHAATNIELVSGTDPHDEQRQIFGQRWGLDEGHLYADYRQMLQKENLDIVSICTTARHRAAIIEDVAAAGVKAIWAEKPLALTLAQADTIVETCQRHNVVIAVNCARRWNPFFHQARSLADAGELGEILQVTAYANCGLSHNGSHAIDTLRYLAGGQVKWVFGEMASDEAAEQGDPQGNGYLAFDNGVRAYLRSMPTGIAMWEFDMIGTQGRIRSGPNGEAFELQRLSSGGLRNRGVPATEPFPLPARMPGMGITIVNDIIDAIQNGGAPRCSGEDGRAALEIAIALRESHRQGGIRIELPLANRDLGIESSEIAQDGTPARIRRLQANS
jgi:predicted dehydrogenase